MKKIYLYLGLLSCFLAFGQGTVITSPPLTANNGQQGVTFEVESSVPIIITEIANTYNTGAQTTSVWMRTGGVQSTPGTPPNISVANGWTQIITNATATGNNTTPVTIPGGPYSIAIPANTPVGFFIEGGLRYQSHTGPPDVFSDGTLTIRTGTNFGYGGSAPSPAFHPRQFLGEVTYMLAGPCTAPPTAGATQAADTTICVGNTTRVSLTGGTAGMGQTYQWESSTDNITWTTMVNDTLPAVDVTLTASTYFRCQVTCSGQTDASTPLLVNAIGTPLPAGTYTINKNLPSSATNFISFNDFAQSITCGGVAGPVVVNVAPNTGPYLEAVKFTDINTTATNTITINGNGETIEGAPIGTTGADRGIFILENTSYFTIDDLVVKSASNFGTIGAGVLVFGACTDVTIKNCFIDLDYAITGFNTAAIGVTSNATSFTAGGGAVANNITIEDNIISGGYNGISLIAASNTVRADNNIIRNNQIIDFFIYGIYIRNQDNMLVTRNEIARENRTNLSSFYAIASFGEQDGAEISFNSIHDPFGNVSNTNLIYAIYMSGASGTAANPNYVFNNRLYNLNNNGTLYGIWNATSSHWKFYHNSIEINDNNPTAALTRAFYLSGNSDGVDIVNNIASVSRTGTSAKHCIYVLGTGTRTINNNGYFMDFNATTNAHVGFDGADRTTFSDWVANSNGWDNNSVFDNPDFTNPATGLLTPGSGAMNDIGQNLLTIVPTDFLDSARTTTPDPGAFEFDPPPCPRPSANVASRTDTSVLVTWTSGIAGGTYEIEWGPTGFTRGTGNFQTVNADSLNITGLA
ncbi:MAG: hypothetical protein LAT76_09525, partial [Schleiferiaceae bacterium]|nr:hypothetical protein [Schleiferiaceae bacterium]